MDESQEIDAARKLFFEYADTLNQEFLDDESTAHMQEKCLAIGEELLQLGFWILARSMQILEANQLPDGAMQSVITLKHDMILVRKDAPAYKPFAKASPVSKVFGKPTDPQLPAKRADTPLSDKEKWLERILNSLDTGDDMCNPHEHHSGYHE